MIGPASTETVVSFQLISMMESLNKAWLLRWSQPRSGAAYNSLVVVHNI